MSKENIKKLTERNAYKKVSEIQLMDFNPRFTNFLDINWNELRQRGNKRLEDEIAIDLLYLEEDFTNFKTLIKSLSKGYMQDGDLIICMAVKNNEIIVLEGNRRILALKMLSDIDYARRILGTFISKVKFENDDQTFNSDEEFEFDEMEIKSKTASANEVLKLIENINSQEKNNISLETEIMVQLFKYDEKDFTDEELNLIKSAILSRSVSAPGGKLKWPRFQTLSNTYQIYQLMCAQGNEDPLEKTAEYLNKSKSATVAELTNATFIFILKKYYTSNMLKNWKSLRTSAIELSINTISLRGITYSSNLKDELEISWKLGEENIEIKGKTPTELSNFLIDNFIIGNYSTRGWKKNKSKKNLFEFFGKDFNETNFYQILNSEASSEEDKNAIKNIEKYSKKLVEFINSISNIENIEKKPVNTNFSISDSQFILRRYVKRILMQEVELLNDGINDKDKFTYPYYSLVLIARSFFELMLNYTFVWSDEIQKEVKDWLNNSRWPKETKLYNNLNAMNRKEIFNELYVDFSKKKFDLLTSSIKNTFRNGPIKYERYLQIISQDITLSKNLNCFEEIVNSYNNTKFNLTAHKPYWLVHFSNLSEIEELVESALKIINCFSKILDIK